MSSNPYTRTQPGDLTDESLNRNLKFVKPHPNRKGESITIAACNQCKLCGQQFDLKVSKCPDCGSPSFREYGENELIYIPTRGATAHIRRKVVYCWNSTEDPISGDVSRHQLVEKRRDVVNLSTKEFHREAYCATCGGVYTFSEGRLASEEELERAKAGKIPAPAPSRMIMGKGNSP